MQTTFRVTNLKTGIEQVFSLRNGNSDVLINKLVETGYFRNCTIEKVRDGVEIKEFGKVVVYYDEVIDECHLPKREIEIHAHTRQ